MDAVSAENKAVLQAMQEMMTSTDFINAQVTFMNTHCNTFDENDENKLEYTGIYESYVQIMEQIIDVKLKDKFAEGQVDAFYIDFT